LAHPLVWASAGKEGSAIIRVREKEGSTPSAEEKGPENAVAGARRLKCERRATTHGITPKIFLKKSAREGGRGRHAERTKRGGGPRELLLTVPKEESLQEVSGEATSLNRDEKGGSSASDPGEEEKRSAGKERINRKQRGLLPG